MKRLLWLAGHMQTIGADMDYYGGFSELGEHGRQLIGAGRIAESWASEVAVAKKEAA